MSRKVTVSENILQDVADAIRERYAASDAIPTVGTKEVYIWDGLGSDDNPDNLTFFQEIYDKFKAGEALTVCVKPPHHGHSDKLITFQGINDINSGLITDSWIQASEDGSLKVKLDIEETSDYDEANGKRKINYTISLLKTATSSTTGTANISFFANSSDITEIATVDNFTYDFSSADSVLVKSDSTYLEYTSTGRMNLIVAVNDANDDSKSFALMGQLDRTLYGTEDNGHFMVLSYEYSTPVSNTMAHNTSTQGLAIIGDDDQIVSVMGVFDQTDVEVNFGGFYDTLYEGESAGSVGFDGLDLTDYDYLEIWARTPAGDRYMKIKPTGNDKVDFSSTTYDSASNSLKIYTFVMTISKDTINIPTNSTTTLASGSSTLTTTNSYEGKYYKIVGYKQQVNEVVDGVDEY